jgi:hypothetical protein
LCPFRLVPGLARPLAASASKRQGVDCAGHPLGWIPEIATAEDAKPLVQRMIGPYMGANQNKGLTFNWLLDHIRDGQDKA